ncbi:uncharacterized protein LOC126837978 [Adelges cooleyi]|uniref:uncharacterized protein LOC126837978 n=1 Tax=Adelges cooleyi TaxID=133065 RepID=UPI0021807520|nr:uncharacterized protein LOC126837978 [Adelges cooleyi]
MTQSVGVNLDQVKHIVDLVKESEKAVDKIPPKQFIAKLVELGVKNVRDWKYEAGTTDGQKTQSVMVYLAKNNKTDDKWVTRSLSSQEVIVFLSLFTYNDKHGSIEDGLLNPDEVKSVIQALKLNQAGKRSLEWFFQGDETVNFAEFLFGFLTVKERGIDGLDRGLDMNQITFLSNNILQNKNYDFIPSANIITFIDWLRIVVGQHDEWKFERFQKWPLEMQELVVVSAEYNTTANDKKGVIPAFEVRGYVWRFAAHDKNLDGFLSGVELDEVVKCTQFEGETVSSLMDGDSSGDKKLDILEIFALLIKKLKQ